MKTKENISKKFTMTWFFYVKKLKFQIIYINFEHLYNTSFLLRFLRFFSKRGANMTVIDVRGETMNK